MAKKRKIHSKAEKSAKEEKCRKFWRKARKNMKTLLTNIPDDLKARLRETEEANRKLIERIENLK